MRRRTLALLTVIAAGLSGAVQADESSDLLSGAAYLRAVSLDLRGTLPTDAEYAAVGDGELDEAMLDAWLADPAFAQQVVRFHRGLFLNNLEIVDPNTDWFRLRTVSGSIDIHYAQSRAGETPYGWSEDSCSDFETHLDPDGRPVPDDSGLIDGWVWVTPPWDDEPRRICAALLEDNLVSPAGTDCLYWDGLNDDPDCGCGPDAAWCWDDDMIDIVNASFAEDIDRRVEAMVLEDRSYLELLTDDRAWVNGPIVHWIQEKNDLVFKGADMGELPYAKERMPELDFSEQDTWAEVTLTGNPSGILTSPAFLLRFQSDRTRANRFYNDFLCTTFEAPEGGVDFTDSVPTLDLTARDSCNYCHALLEPAAATWGRWVGDGARYLEPDAYPPFSEYCEYCGEGWEVCPKECEPYVQAAIVPEEQPYVGWLRAYEFLEERHHHHVEEGPRLLVEQGLADGRLPRCVAAKAAGHLLGRQLTTDDEDWLMSLSGTLESSGWSYRELTRAIVTSPQYRRVQ